MPVAEYLVVVDEAAARASMRTQIATLERELGGLAYELGVDGRAICIAEPGVRGHARLLDLGELEATRDALVAKVRSAQCVLEHCEEREAAAHVRLETILAEPCKHRFERVPLSALGEPGCGAYEVRPRLGLLGMLFDWWCVKLSSGCP